MVDIRGFLRGVRGVNDATAELVTNFFLVVGGLALNQCSASAGLVDACKKYLAAHDGVVFFSAGVIGADGVAMTVSGIWVFNRFAIYGGRRAFCIVHEDRWRDECHADAQAA